MRAITPSDEFDLGYIATQPGEDGVVTATDEYDVYLGITGKLSPDAFEAAVADTLETLQPCVIALLRDLAARLPGDAQQCALIRLSLSGAATPRWSAEQQAAAGLPSPPVNPHGE